MRPEKTPEELTAIRHKYEHTDQPLEEIARDHRMSSRTLHAWARRWNWTPRCVPLPAEGPPPTPPQIASAAPLLLPAPQGPPLVPAQADASAMNDAQDSAPLPPQIDAAPLAPMHADAAMPEPGADLPGDPDTPTALRLQNAVAGVLAAIEAIVAKISTGRTAESDRSARALAALTRTLRELNTLQSQYEEPTADDDSPVDIDEFRRALARKIDAFVAAQGGGVRDDPEPQGA
jgi:hypothetical protein